VPDVNISGNMCLKGSQDSGPDYHHDRHRRPDSGIESENESAKREELGKDRLFCPQAEEEE